MVDAGNEEVLVRVLDPEQLVPHRAPDDIRVEAERADVAADLGRHGWAGWTTTSPYRWATASISTRAPDGRAATWNVERAGGWSPTRVA